LCGEFCFYQARQFAVALAVALSDRTGLHGGGLSRSTAERLLDRCSQPNTSKYAASTWAAISGHRYCSRTRCCARCPARARAESSNSRNRSIRSRSLTLPGSKRNPAPSTSSRFSGMSLASTHRPAPIASSNASDPAAAGLLCGLHMTEGAIRRPGSVRARTGRSNRERASV
jgi:hypothetical protein